ncbi:Synaptic vesicle 2-related protein [Seminavis robusta]|uniref:Synaptic vesicle 2-related protein n=1 Tax=Seminavis robusta TaxID=568900 RepID=A0A9N8H4D6_9STRA|nr:Synaptic vesicle 2-related protein [Seminavis robusta]|eukprot:Sro47_g027710.1 Synaptic vesicle 2-related protein (627) ;mRNA; r:35355-37235
MASTTTSTVSNRKPSKRRYQNIPGQEAGAVGTEDEAPLSLTTSSVEEHGEESRDLNVHTANISNEMSIDDAIDRLGMGIFQYRILIAAGLCFAADAMEVLLLSFLSIVLQEEWGLSNDETAFITSILFAGALIGTSILGPLSDKWGRRPVFLLAATLIAFFGMGTSLAPNYEAILVVFFCIGFGVGGLTVPFDTLAEFLPSEGRGTNLLLIEYFWTIGCLLVIVFAELTLAHGKANWRLFVILCSIPCFVSIIVGHLCVPESVRWLVSEGRNEEALHILRQAAVTNKLTATTPLTQDDSNGEDDNSHVDDVDLIFPLDTQLTSDEDHSAENSASFLDLFKPQWRGIMLRIWGAWGGFGLGYYGAIMSITRIFDSEGAGEDVWTNSTLLDANATLGGETDHLQVTETTDFDYSAIFISSSAELLGTTLVIVLVDRVGRIPSQVVCYAGAGACIFLMCTLASSADTAATAASDRWELVGLGFLLRALDMAATCTSWVMTAEVLSTEIRGVGHSSANAVARLGAFFSPFLVDTLSLRSLGIVMLIVHWFAAACVSQLPETKGARMGGGGETETISSLQLVETTDRLAHHNHDAADGPASSEPDGLFVIDDENGDEPITHGNGPEIRILT